MQRPISIPPPHRKSLQTLNDVLIAMRRVEPRLISYYDELQVEDDNEDCLECGQFCRHDLLKENEEFLKIMITDSCFALEIMLDDKRLTAGEQSEYDSHDPIFGAERMIW
ncbi:hypothetical protein MA16_Dca003769 [Dendrobium catenatum]|uniref:Uncharacterized protein n=1 Tax=Dendrobium catenatum TaxID=906689 RepID=A0A2I0WFW8_9ASPA|nr:hypothetical protein MA16_Dca003769 [Dendrobium catenatum]